MHPKMTKADKKAGFLAFWKPLKRHFFKAKKYALDIESK
jgi:hypothetical protein